MIKPTPIALMQPHITDAMRAAVQETLCSRWIGQGPKVDAFEQAFGEYVARHDTRRPAPGCEPVPVAVNSGTSALHLAYLLAGIGPGSTVAAPLFTCTATSEPLLWLGANIRFIDVEPGGLNMDRDALKAAIARERIDAVVVVNYGGAPARALARGSGPVLIEDCAQSLGTGAYLSSAAYRCYSFQAVKHLTTGDGGMLLCPADQAPEPKRRRWFGIDRAAKLGGGVWENDIKEIGFKYQMTDISASMGLAGLEDLDNQMAWRHFLRAAYIESLEHVPGVRVLDQDEVSACWLMTVLVERREDLIRKLKEHGIESGQAHYRNDRYTKFARFRRPGEFPNMDWIDSRYLCLPMHMGLDLADVGRICEVIAGGW